MGRAQGQAGQGSRVGSGGCTLRRLSRLPLGGRSSRTLEEVKEGGSWGGGGVRGVSVSWSSGGSTETGSQGAGEGRATGHSGSGPCVHCPILHCSRSQQGRWGGPHRTLPSRLSLRQAGDRGCGSNLSLGPELMAHRESLFPRSGVRSYLPGCCLPSLRLPCPRVKTGPRGWGTLALLCMLL